jgi:hypothetical protein
MYGRKVFQGDCLYVQESVNSTMKQAISLTKGYSLSHKVKRMEPSKGVGL